MVNTVVLVLILCCNLFAGVFVFQNVRQVKKSVSEQIENLFSPGKDDKGAATPSPFALMVHNTAVIIASELEQRISAMMMGKASSISKAITSVEGEMALEAASNGNPLLSALINFSPALQKKITKSPALGMALQALSSGGLGNILGGGSPSNNGNGHKPTAQSKLGF
jgi:hypothetical protein